MCVQITNLRPMATPECHKGKTSIMPYRASTPITPGVEHLFLSDLDNTASPLSEQGTINGFSCDMTTDCSANDSVGSPDYCKGMQQGTPTSDRGDRRTSLYTKIMTEATFSLARSPAKKTAEDGMDADDSHRSLAETSERSINAELKPNTLRMLMHLDSGPLPLFLRPTPFASSFSFRPGQSVLGGGLKRPTGWTVGGGYSGARPLSDPAVNLLTQTHSGPCLDKSWSYGGGDFS